MRANKLLIGALMAFAPIAAADSSKAKSDDVFFEFDSSQLTAQGRATLDNMASAACRSLNEKLVLAAHSDPRGTAPYNVGLSTRRAESVRQYLVAKGVDRDMIVLAMYGEDGPKRATFAEDRRVSLTLTDQPLYSIIDEALPVATAVTWRKPATTAQIEGPLRQRQPDAVAGR